MDMIIEYLNDTLGDNYIYIIGIAAILLFILVGFLASRKGPSNKKPLNNEPMINIDDISTGEINQVANTLDQEKINPVDVAEMPATDALVVDREPIIPVDGASPLEESVNLTTDTPGTLRLDAFAQPIPATNEDLVAPGTQMSTDFQSKGAEFNQMPNASEMNDFEGEKPKTLLNVDDVLGKIENTSSVSIPNSLPETPEIESQPEIIDIVDEPVKPESNPENVNVDYNPHVSESMINTPSVNENLIEEEPLNQEKEGV